MRREGVRERLNKLFKAMKSFKAESGMSSGWKRRNKQMKNDIRLTEYKRGRV